MTKLYEGIEPSITPMRFCQELRTISIVPRWSIVRTIQKQNVAEHSYFVTLYTSQICRFLYHHSAMVDENFILNCLERALWHDQDECATGDIPAPTKRRVVDTDKYAEYVDNVHVHLLGNYERRHKSGIAAPYGAVVKLADKFDELMFLATDYQLGNTHVSRLLTSAMFKLKNLCMELSTVHRMCTPLVTTCLYTSMRAAAELTMETGARLPVDGFDAGVPGAQFRHEVTNDDLES